MALKALAVSGMTLTYAAPITGPLPTIITPPSTKVAAGGGVYKDNTQITIPAGITNGSCTSVAPVNANIPATSVKTLVEGVAPLRVDDEITVSGISGQTGGGSSCTLSATVRIQNAGQEKVVSE